jgi:glycosyltransferase involved in cell wall biosynthesis
MSSDAEKTLSDEQVRYQLSGTHDAQGCLELAAAADASSNTELSRACLERAVALDRFCQPALLNLAALALSEEDGISAFSMLEEAARVSPLPTDVEPLREQLYAAVRNVPELEHYLRLVGRIAPNPADQRRSILVVTSAALNDSADGTQDVDALVAGLRTRGHDVKVLAPDNEPDALRLCSTWANGKVKPLAGSERESSVAHNSETIERILSASKLDLVLATHLELLDISVLQPALKLGIPVLHLVATARPSFSADDQPREAHYWMSPVSDWTGTALRNASYETARMESIHPATPLDRYFRLFLPDISRLRICLLAALRPASGAETLIRALAELAQQGISVTASIAGDEAETGFVERLKALARELRLENVVGFSEAVKAQDVPAFLARHNVLVFGAQLPEPFGPIQVQAMASGLIVLSTGLGGSKEVIQDQVDGLLYAASNATDLAAKLASLAGNPERMAAFQRQAQKRATVFSTENAVKQVESLAAELQAVARSSSEE